MVWREMYGGKGGDAAIKEQASENGRDEAEEKRVPQDPPFHM